MTPFDPIALLAMLQAFYPIVGPAAFARARAERPDYFSAGTIIGTSGDALRLPDGRIFDCIFDVGGPSTRWQCIDVTAGGGTGAVDDPFALEAGPLVPIDLSAWPASSAPPVFVPLVASYLYDLGASATVLDAAHETIVLHSSPLPLENAFGREIGGAESRLSGERWALDQADPMSILMAVAAGGHAIDAETGQYDEPPPVDFSPGELPPPPGIDTPNQPDQP